MRRTARVLLLLILAGCLVLVATVVSMWPARLPWSHRPADSKLTGACLVVSGSPPSVTVRLTNHSSRPTATTYLVVALFDTSGNQVGSASDNVQFGGGGPVMLAPQATAYYDGFDLSSGPTAATATTCDVEAVN